MTKSSTILKRAKQRVERCYSSYAFARTAKGMWAGDKASFPFPGDWMADNAVCFCSVGAVFRETRQRLRPYPKWPGSVTEYSDRGKPYALRLFDKAIELAEAAGD